MKVNFACKVFRTEHAQIPGYPLVKDHWILSKYMVSWIGFVLMTPKTCDNYRQKEQTDK